MVRGLLRQEAAALLDELLAHRNVLAAFTLETSLRDRNAALLT